MRSLIALALALMLQAQKPPDGIGLGYDGELRHVSRQLLELAEALPEEKYSWRPAEGVRSFGEVYVHVILGNFFLLNETGIAPPKELRGVDLTKRAGSKAEMVKWLRTWLEAVKSERAKSTPESRLRQVQFLNKQVDTNVDGIYLRVLVHLNEHMGQLIAYARMNGVKPPWSAKE